MWSPPVKVGICFGVHLHQHQQMIMGPSENTTRLSLASFDGVKTGQESAVFERLTDLDAFKIAEVEQQHGSRERSY
jgi:hypothetical protein